MLIGPWLLLWSPSDELFKRVVEGMSEANMSRGLGFRLWA